MSRAAASNSGCLGMLGLGFLVLVGMCTGGGDHSSRPEPLSSAYTAPSEVQTEDFYAHVTLNVRSGPGTNYPVVRTVQRGQGMRLGPKDGNGWAQIYPPYGNPDGYVYRASEQVRSYAPSVETHRSTAVSSSERRRARAEANGYYLGPRGGCYTYSASGRKRYVDHSYCY